MSVAKMYVGLDLGNEKNALCVVDDAGRLVGQRLARNDLDTLDGLRSFTKNVEAGQVHVAVEDRKNAVVDALVGFSFIVFTINPKQVDRFRDRFSVAGAKDDRRDAFVLASSLRTDPIAFHRVELEPAAQIELRSLAARINDLDGEHRRMSNQLRAQVLRYFPALLSLLAGCDLPWFWALVKLLKTPAIAAGVADDEVRDVLRKLHVRKVKAPDVRAVVDIRHLPTSAGVANVRAGVDVCVEVECTPRSERGCVRSGVDTRKGVLACDAERIGATTMAAVMWSPSLEPESEPSGCETGRPLAHAACLTPHTVRRSSLVGG
jgi:hypothetical protein